MKTKRILTIMVLLGFSLTARDMGLGAGTGGILPGAKVQQEKTGKEDEKKEEEKNKKEEEKDKKPKRVWTDEDIEEIKKEKVKNITEIPPDTNAEKGTGQKEVVDLPHLVSNTTEGDKYDEKKTEKYWRERKKALVNKIIENEAEIKNLETKLFELQMQLNGTDTLSDQLRLAEMFNATSKKLENYRKGLESMKQELEGLTDEARKAGVPPGWLRD
jgi:hypothetical protein